MAIDIRAIVTCSLGTLIDANISDDYIQGSGLIKTRGSCTIKGLISPPSGTLVTFSYTKDGITRNIPRKLRVLSSFSDAFRNITTVELGCKLTYAQDLQEPLKWDAFNDPLNFNRSRSEAEIVTIPIHAVSVARRCLQAIGVSALSVPLTNRFSIAEFDFGSGYVNILSNLLVSESFCGYLDEREELAIIRLANPVETGPLIASSDLIDIAPIGIGQVQADAVFVTYSTLKLRVPDEAELSGDDLEPVQWGKDISESINESEVVIQWADFFDNPKTSVYNVLDTSVTETFYKVFTVKQEDGSTERRNLIDRRITTQSKTNVGVISNIFQQYLDNGLKPPALKPLETVTTETFAYDKFGNQIRAQSIKVGHPLYEVGSLGVDFVDEDGNGVDITVFDNVPPIPLEETIVESRIAADFRTSKTTRFTTWARTIYGQQAIAEARESLEFSSDVTAYLLQLVDSNALVPVTVSTVTDRTGFRGEEAPSEADITNAKFSSASGDPNNGYRVESVARVEVITGNRFATRRIELSMPFAPDDTFRRSGSSFRATRSDARNKAATFGRVQNRMLLGNRYGANIQIAPEKLPRRPFDPFVLEVAGTYALYRVNAASWVLNASGIVATTDAMFWGTAGRSQ